MIGQYKWYIIHLFLLTLTVLLQFCAKHQYLPITNHFIPDSYAYEMRVLYERTIDPLSDGFTSFNRTLYNIGPFSFIFVNSIFLLSSVYFSKIFEFISPNSVTLARFIIIFNPYLLVGAIGPNKETVLIFLSLLSFYLFFQRSGYIKVLGFGVAILALFVRPIFGLVLVLSILLIPLIRLFKNPVNLFLCFLIIFFVANAIPPINSAISAAQGEGDELPYFQGSNILEVALFLKLMNQNPILQLPAFLVKTGLILITPIFRPNPFYTIPYPLLDAGYSFIAYTLLPFNISLLLLFFNKGLVSSQNINKETQILILYCLIGVLTTIINSNITFRYLFPYSPVIVSIFYLHSTKIRNRILMGCFFILSLIFAGTTVFFRKEFETDSTIIPQFLSWF